MHPLHLHRMLCKLVWSFYEEVLIKRVRRVKTEIFLPVLQQSPRVHSRDDSRSPQFVNLFEFELSEVVMCVMKRC